jgi:hypothetical protein
VDDDLRINFRILVPTMYLLIAKVKERYARWRNKPVTDADGAVALN